MYTSRGSLPGANPLLCGEKPTDCGDIIGSYNTKFDCAKELRRKNASEIECIQEHKERCKSGREARHTWVGVMLSHSAYDSSLTCPAEGEGPAWLWGWPWPCGVHRVDVEAMLCVCVCVCGWVCVCCDCAVIMGVRRWGLYDLARAHRTQ